MRVTHTSAELYRFASLNRESTPSFVAHAGFELGHWAFSVLLDFIWVGQQNPANPELQLCSS